MIASNASIEEKIKALQGPVFVFGASGFIGANLFETLLKYRKDVFAITHDIRQAWRLKLLNANAEQILFCDILFKNSVKLIFEKYQPATVFNLAAYGAYSRQQNSNLIYQTNLEGTLNIIEESRNVSAYVHAGSSSEYGFNCENPAEDSELIPNSHYSVSKVSAAYLIKYYARVHQFPGVNLRLYSAFGKWEEPDRLIPQLIEKAQHGKLIPLVSPDISRDFVYAQDCITALVNSAVFMRPEIAGHSINIGTGIKTTMKQLVDTATELFQIKQSAEWGSMENRKWDLQNWYGNFAKVEQLIYWKPETSLREGLQKTAQWQKEIKYEDTVLPAFSEPRRLNKISCIIACYKDAQAIPVMYERLVKMFEGLKVRYEIIFVNDASPDNSQEVLNAICAKDPDVIAVTHSRNFGSQSAFLSGMEISTGDAVVLMDGDLQDPPEVIPAFYEKWLNGYEVVYGQRIKREATFTMNLMYKLFYRIYRKLSYIKIPVDAGDFSMIDRKVVNELIKLPETDQFLRGLRAWVGFKQTGVDYIRPERLFGRSTNNWNKNIWWAKKAIFSFSFAPLEMLSYLGFVLTIISFVAIVVQIIGRIMYPDIPHGIPTIIVLILFFGGIQLLAVSILGEYLSKIFEETKSRPKFIRKSIIHRGKKLESTAEMINLVENARK